MKKLLILSLLFQFAWTLQAMPPMFSEETQQEASKEQEEQEATERATSDESRDILFQKDDDANSLESREILSEGKGPREISINSETAAEKIASPNQQAISFEKLPIYRTACIDAHANAIALVAEFRQKHKNEAEQQRLPEASVENLFSTSEWMKLIDSHFKELSAINDYIALHEKYIQALQQLPSTADITNQIKIHSEDQKHRKHEVLLIKQMIAAAELTKADLESKKTAVNFPTFPGVFLNIYGAPVVNMLGYYSAERNTPVSQRYKSRIACYKIALQVENAAHDKFQQAIEAHFNYLSELNGDNRARKESASLVYVSSQYSQKTTQYTLQTAQATDDSLAAWESLTSAIDIDKTLAAQEADPATIAATKKTSLETAMATFTQLAEKASTATASWNQDQQLRESLLQEPAPIFLLTKEDQRCIKTAAIKDWPTNIATGLPLHFKHIERAKRSKAFWEAEQLWASTAAALAEKKIELLSLPANAPATTRANLMTTIRSISEQKQRWENEVSKFYNSLTHATT